MAWPLLILGAIGAIVPDAPAQVLLHPTSESEPVTLLPSDLSIFESGQVRRDLPCTVAERKPDLGFDLRFHSGYDVRLPMSEVSGAEDLLTVVLRAYPERQPDHPSYFVQKFRVPNVSEDAKGDAELAGALDLGLGKYHVDWLMRDRMERICSSSWDLEAALPVKERPPALFLPPNEIRQTTPGPFYNDDSSPDSKVATADGLRLKLMVNFAPQTSQSAAFTRNDTDALVSILKTISRDPHVTSISLVAFNMGESRILYRQEAAQTIDFPALGKALDSVHLGTVSVGNLSDKHSDTNFLQHLIDTELSPSSPTPGQTPSDGIIFAGPKAMLAADVPQSELRRIGSIECPVFYLNYNLNPQAVPWKDSISRAIKVFRGTEYTISRPRDLWVSTAEMFTRIRSWRSSRSALSHSTGRPNTAAPNLAESFRSQ